MGNIDIQFQRLFERVKANPSIIEANRKVIEDDIAHLQARGSNVKTWIKHIYCLRIYFEAFGEVDAKDSTKKDVERAMAKIEASSLSSETKRDIRAVVKAMYKNYLGDGYNYPECCRWLKTGDRGVRRGLKPDSMLSEMEIKAILNECNDIRDKAMISVLYDAGLRLGELIEMKVKDVELNTNPAHVTVDGKTGLRRVPIFFSAAYLAQFLNANKGKKPDDYLWTPIGSWKFKYRNVKLDSNAVRKILKAAAKKAGIEKRVYAHLLRHSRATHYANKLTEQQLKKYFGWTGSSDMASVYVHLNDQHLDDALLKANGLENVRHEIKEPELKIKECPRCQYPNPPDNIYCSKCGSGLDISVAVRMQEMEKKGIASIFDDVDNPGHMLKKRDRMLQRRAKKK